MAEGVINYSNLRWALIPAITAHNFEEWLTFPRAGRGVGKTLENIGLGLRSPEWDVTQLALILATVIPIAVVIYSCVGKHRKTKDFCVCLVAGVFFANVFLPHIPSAILLGGYSPGLVTAVFINFPLSLLLWRYAVVEKILSIKQIVVSALAGLILLFPSIITMMLLADQLLLLQAG